MKRRYFMIAATAMAAGAIPAHSQDVVQPAPKGVMTFERRVMSLGGPENVEFISTEASVAGKVVKGAPYTADAVTERSQTLADGNRISSKNSAATYRDAEGRTRREMTLGAPGGAEAPSVVIINDPAAGTSYHLDMKSKTARKLPAMPMSMSFAGPAGAVHVMRGRTPGEPAAGARVAVPAERAAVVTFTQTSGPEGSVRFKTMSEPKVENLGKRAIDGIEVDGTRSVITIPAGEVGNEREIRIVSERWYSPELQTVILSTHSDPRMGETTYKLSNIKRGEPHPSLFQVPSDFTVANASDFTVSSDEPPPVRILRKLEHE